MLLHIGLQAPAAWGSAFLHRRGAHTVCGSAPWQPNISSKAPGGGSLHVRLQTGLGRTFRLKANEHLPEQATGNQHPMAVVSAFHEPAQDESHGPEHGSPPPGWAVVDRDPAAVHLAAPVQTTAAVAAAAAARLQQQQQAVADGQRATMVQVLERPEFLPSGSATDSIDYDMADREFSSSSEDELIHGTLGTYGSIQERPTAAGYSYNKSNYEVVRLDASGRTRKFYVRRRDLLKEFKLQPRDLRRIDPSIDFTKTSPSITIKENVLLLCLGGIKAIVTAEKALLFEPNNLATKRLLETMVPHLRNKLNRSQAAQQGGGPYAEQRDGPGFGSFGGAGGGIGVSALDTQNRQLAALSHTEYMARFYAKTEQGAMRSLPFELDVLEGALIGATGRLDAELAAVTKRVQELLNRLPADINPVSLEELRRVKAALVELEDKADNMRELLEELMDDEDELRELNLSSRPRREERRRQRERDRLERELERAREIKEELEERLEEGEGGPSSNGSSSGKRSPSRSAARQARPWVDPGGWQQPGQNGYPAHSPGGTTPVNGYASWSGGVKHIAGAATSTDGQAQNNSTPSDARQQRLAELRAKFDRQRLAELRSKFSWGTSSSTSSSNGSSSSVHQPNGSSALPRPLIGTPSIARDVASGLRRSSSNSNGSGSSSSREQREREREAERAERQERIRAARATADMADGNWISRLEQLEDNEEDIQEAQEALEEMVEAEEEEAEMEETEDLLEYYLQRVSTTQSEAERLLEGARDLEESIGVSLSARRYEVNRLELTLSIGSFAAAIGAMIAGIFGMNMKSCLEMSVGGFWGVSAAIVVGCIWVFVAITRYTRTKRIL